MSVVQESGRFVRSRGQMICGPAADWRGPPPPRGCEVFIAGVPTDVSEDELLSAFQQVGPVYQFRFMVDIGGRGRGFAFCTFAAREDAHRAIMALDGHQIRPNARISVVRSVDNRSLRIGYVPLHKTSDEIGRELSAYAGGIKEVSLPPSQEGDLGVVHVEFESHRSACLARRIFLSGGVRLFNRDMVTMEWAEPDQEVTTLLVRNMPVHWDEHHVETFFSRRGLGKARKVVKKENFIFVDYLTRENAENIMMKLNGTYLAGKKIKVCWAKPLRKAPAAPNTSIVQDVQVRVPSQNYVKAGAVNKQRARDETPALLKTTHVQELANVCVDKQYGDPYYKVFKVTGPNDSINYTSKVTIRNFPFWSKTYGSAGSFSSAAVAKDSAAHRALGDMAFW
ncbi:probable RNA-binding protein 46 [Caerostris darwini]|uniref:Probable RNA-binding protein 46 n=1 Tax=Caerostris darwini TaxID=1538125 RepID=A0AAV4PHA8_9ARAC|nr:probable RNA-binding protein 46 [Caerostris darwini]